MPSHDARLNLYVQTESDTPDFVNGLLFGEAPPQPQSPADVQAMWRRTLGAERKLLDALIDSYPAPLGRSDLAACTELAQSGGTFGTYLSRLRSNGLIVEDGGSISAAAILFENAR